MYFYKEVEKKEEHFSKSSLVRSVLLINHKNADEGFHR